MKHLSPLNARRICIAVFCLVVFSLNYARAGGLSGTYTIGSSGTYGSFTKAVSDLTTNGVSGAVVFKVDNGTYTEQVSIGNITGASATNTITFQSAKGDSSKVILTSASSSSASDPNYTLELNKSRFVIIKQISIVRTGTATYGVSLALTGNTNSCQFLGNLIVGTVNPNTSGSVTTYGGAVNSTGADTADLFKGNRIKNGMNCMAFNGTSTGYNNVIMNNILDTAGQAGIYATNTETNLLISGNTFNMGAFPASVAHALSYGVRLESASSLTITKNRFYSTAKASTCRCINLVNCTISNSVRSLVANNFIWVAAGSSASTAVAIYGASYIDFIYNNVLETAIPSNSACIFFNGTSATDMVIANNNLVNLGSGTCIDNGYTTTGVSTENYNNMYSKGTYIGKYGSSSGLYTTFAKWQAGTSFDTKSINVDPGFVSNTDMHVSSSALNGAATPFSSVTDDIDGDARNSTTPDIGADEFTPPKTDAGVTLLSNPANFCASSSKLDVIANFTDFGTDDITSVTINWSVNGVLQTPYSWTGTLKQGNISSGVTLGQFVFSSKNAYIIKMWTSSPNGGVDQKASNDTIVKSIASGLSGSYTLGGTTPDFATFNAVVDAITVRGVCGATVINVRDGSYTEQLTLPAFASMSATNTVTFQSEKLDSTKVTLTRPDATSTGLNNCLIQINGGSFFIFKKMTLTRSNYTSGSFGNIIELKSKATNNSFLNCRIIGPIITSSTTNADIVVSAADKDTSNIFRNNLFKYGNSAFNLFGDASSPETNNVIDGNIIDSTYITPILVTYDDGIAITNNKITNCNIANTTYYGMVLNTCNNGIIITGNKINMNYGAAGGINLTSCTGGSKNPGLIANNFVSINTTSTASSPYGLYNNSSTNQNYYFNSVNITATNTGSAFYTNTTVANLNVTDNIFANNGGGYAIVSSVGKAPFNSTDYNDIYTTGTSVASYGGTADADLAAWQSATSMAAKSVSIKPYYNSASDLHTVNTFLKGIGTSVGVTTDIDGKTRPSTPSMGASEISPAALDATVSAISVPTCSGTQSVTVTLGNNGSSTITSAKIGWSVGGTAQTTYSYSGSIAATKSASVVIGTYAFSSGSAVIKAWSISPNGKTDSLPLNDTTTSTVTIAASPKASVISNTSICPGSSISIGSSATKFSSYSWVSSPVGFTSTSSNPAPSPTVATTYTLTETSSLTGCSATNSVTITMATPPAAYVGPAVTVCAGNTVQIGGAAVTGNGYSWTSSPAGFTSSVSNPYVTPSVTTTYTLTETKGTCATTNSVTVTANALPTANAGSNASICNGSSTSIGATAVSGSSYFWLSIPSGFTSASANPTVSPAVTTTYVLYETNTATSCTNLGAVVVTVNALPAANAGANSSVCAGSSITIGSTAVSGNSYSWSSSPSGFTSSTSNPSVTPTATTTYTLKETTSAGCSASNSTTVTYNALPTATITSATTTACIGNTVSMSISSTGTGFLYQWYFNGSPISGATKTTYNAATTGDYTAMITNGSNCSAMSNKISITISALPVTLIKTQGSASRCAGDSVTLIGSTRAGATYQWYADNVAIAGATDFQYVAKTSGQYAMTITNTGGCVSDTTKTSIPVVFNTAPTASISPATTTTICEGGNVPMNTNAYSNATYTWLMNNVPITGANTKNYDAKLAGTYNVIIKDNASGCATASATTVVKVNVAPVAVIKALGNTKICDGTNLILSANKPADASSTYQWSKGGSVIKDATSDTLNATTAGDYTLMVTNSASCSATSDKLTVTVSTPATVSITAPASTTTCEGSPIKLQSTVTGSTSLQWTLDGNKISGATADNVSADKTGNYTILAANADGCDASASVSITVNASPVSKFTMGSSKVCVGSPASFFNESYITSGTVKYSWDFGNGDTSTAVNPTENFKAAGAVNVKLTAKSNLGCSTTSTQAVTVLGVNASTFTAVHQGFRRMVLTPTDLTGTTYTWDFGDNTGAKGQTPVHQYDADGSYTVTLTVTNANGCSSATTSTVKVDASGISQSSQADVSINVFPNPFQGKTNVIYNLNQNSSVAIEVFDILGKRVANVENSKQVAGEHSFIFNGQNAGTYFIRLVIDGKPYVSKVIQQD